MLKKLLFVPAPILLACYLFTIYIGQPAVGGWLLMLFFLNITLIFRGTKKLSGFAFTTMIFAAVSLAMYYPQYFVQVDGFKLSKLIIPLLQIIMFGMGSELSLAELGAVLKMPKKIAVGVVCHYTIM